ncbi:TPA: hypothetical protein ACXZSH_002286 [Salmonella enterica]|uniref:hypothetical protein n=1 Tax=Salmonella TaxID=590 RepID=UPI001F4FF7AB|nr:hypothetical protein [Salmonella enterica]
MSNIDKHAVQTIADLKAGYTLGHADVAILNELARIALASLEAEKCAEPVAFINGAWTLVYYRPPKELGLKIGDKLYTAPPAPVSVPAAMEMDDDFDSSFEHGKAVGWNAYRAAMLQSFGNSEQLNSPVIPDGWVMVPVEPTEDMIVNGFESEPDESFSDEKEWKAYDAMSGCQQAAHRAKLCWAAMIEAAPKLE